MRVGQPSRTSDYILNSALSPSRELIYLLISDYHFHQEEYEKSARFLYYVEQVTHRHNISLQPEDQDSFENIKKIIEEKVYREELAEYWNGF